MSIVEVCGIAVIGMTAVVILRDLRPGYAIAAGIVTGLILLTSAIAAFSELADYVRIMSDRDGFSLYSSVILKSFGIGVLAETTADACRDNGASAIAAKVEFAGKIIILLLAVPLVTELLSRTGELIK